ncbi:flagellar hook capping FlgD N-terminal domain-containing protein [Pseudotabrizicola formosa]|uniref:flagellar hook capping FlgD N-terminal domain-containing protein n=1 Tax=Pseudotabrizicola formosa TaxID=2030009 RepID=UPI000CD2677F|nr:flagellar hook capping FlgD N-terminal domain-containing protein [Pseudotabrizicola formosa]
MTLATTQTGTAIGARLAEQQARGTDTTASSDYEMFLRMLTVQMQNQDPLNPIDSADYAVQLATFSGVEQAVRTNQLLESLQSQFGLLGMAQLAGWVGQEARAAAPVYFDGAPVTLSPDPASAADRAVLVVRDAQDRVLSREELPVSTAHYDWAGTDATGATLPPGSYTLTLESYFADTLLDSKTVEYYAQILEARGGVDGTRLVLRGGIEVPASSVTALRMQ